VLVATLNLSNALPNVNFREFYEKRKQTIFENTTFPTLPLK
jgi:hypothetical protein